MFQSTHPRGVRLQRETSRHWRTRFNPRTHGGCDKMIGRVNGVNFMFQSTHPRGVRRLSTTTGIGNRS